MATYQDILDEHSNSGGQPKTYGSLLSQYEPKPEGGFASSLKSVGGALLAGTGQAAKDVGLNGLGAIAVQQGRAIQDANRPAVQSFSDIAEHPGKWISESAGQMGGQAGLAIAGGLAGRAAGAGLGALTGPFAPVAIPALSTAGAYIGGNLPMLAQEYGSARQEQEQLGVDDKGRALTGALATTAIENLGGLRPGGMANLVTDGVNTLAGKSIKEGAKIVGKKMLRSGVEEGLEEIPQEFTGAYAGGQDDLLTAENLQQGLFGAVSAFPGGALFGAGKALGPLARAAQQAPVTPQEAVSEAQNANPNGDADTIINQAREIANATNVNPDGAAVNGSPNQVRPGAPASGVDDTIDNPAPPATSKEQALKDKIIQQRQKEGEPSEQQRAIDTTALNQPGQESVNRPLPDSAIQQGGIDAQAQTDTGIDEPAGTLSQVDASLIGGRNADAGGIDSRLKNIKKRKGDMQEELQSEVGNEIVPPARPPLADDLTQKSDAELEVLRQNTFNVRNSESLKRRAEIVAEQKRRKTLPPQEETQDVRKQERPGNFGTENQSADSANRQRLRAADAVPMERDSSSANGTGEIAAGEQQRELLNQASPRITDETTENAANANEEAGQGQERPLLDFTPTHRLNDGYDTPVRMEDDGSYTDRDGISYTADNEAVALQPQEVEAYRESTRRDTAPTERDFGAGMAQDDTGLRTQDGRNAKEISRASGYAKETSKGQDTGNLNGIGEAYREQEKTQAQNQAIEAGAEVPAGGIERRPDTASDGRVSNVSSGLPGGDQGPVAGDVSRSRSGVSELKNEIQPLSTVSGQAKSGTVEALPKEGDDSPLSMAENKNKQKPSATSDTAIDQLPRVQSVDNQKAEQSASLRGNKTSYPWEMTQHEYAQFLDQGKDTRPIRERSKYNPLGMYGEAAIEADRLGLKATLLRGHKTRVDEAVDAGQSIPDKVLNEYPDLRAKQNWNNLNEEDAKKITASIGSTIGTTFGVDGYKRKWDRLSKENKDKLTEYFKPNESTQNPIPATTAQSPAQNANPNPAQSPATSPSAQAEPMGAAAQPVEPVTYGKVSTFQGHKTISVSRNNGNDSPSELTIKKRKDSDTYHVETPNGQILFSGVKDIKEAKKKVEGVLSKVHVIDGRPFAITKDGNAILLKKAYGAATGGTAKELELKASLQYKREQKTQEPNAPTEQNSIESQPPKNEKAQKESRAQQGSVNEIPASKKAKPAIPDSGLAQDESATGKTNSKAENPQQSLKRKLIEQRFTADELTDLRQKAGEVRDINRYASGRYGADKVKGVDLREYFAQPAQKSQETMHVADNVYKKDEKVDTSATDNSLKWEESDTVKAAHQLAKKTGKAVEISRGKNISEQSIDFKMLNSRDTNKDGVPEKANEVSMYDGLVVPIDKAIKWISYALENNEIGGFYDFQIGRLQFDGSARQKIAKKLGYAKSLTDYWDGVNTDKFFQDHPELKGTKIDDLFKKPKLSQSQPTPGSTVAELTAKLDATDKKLLQSGKLEVVQKASDVPDSAVSVDANGIEGWYDPRTKKIYVVADNVTPATLSSVLAHEKLHAALDQNPALRDRILGAQSELRDIFAQVEAGKYTGRYKTLYDEALRRVNRAQTSEADRFEEWLAYQVTQHNKSPQSLPERMAKAIQNLVAAIRAAIFKYSGKIDKIGPAELSSLAKSVMSLDNKGAQNYSQRKEGVLMSAKEQGYKGNDPEEAEEWVRAKNKGLDMSHEARMERAIKMGFDIDREWHHAGNLNENFIKDKLFLTDDIDAAKKYGSKINDFYIKEQEIFDVDSLDDLRKISKSINIKYNEDGDGIIYFDNKSFEDIVLLVNNSKFKDIVLLKGYSGVWFYGDVTPNGEIVHGTTVIYKQNAIKSIHAAFDPDYADSPNLLASVKESPDIRYSIADDVREFKQRAGLGPKKTLTQTIQDILNRGIDANLQIIKDQWSAMKPKLEQGVFDKFLGIKLAEQEIMGDVAHSLSGYIGARLSTGSSSTMSAVLQYGAPELRDGIIQRKANTKGLAEILQPVKDDMENFAAWMVARRADRLFQEGRENNFTRDQIDAGLSLFKPNYQQVADGIAEMNKAILDLAEKSGLIDPQSRRLWESADYIPFYRIIEEQKTTGPRNKKGLSHQSSGIKMLKGGENPMSDPLGNMMQNWAHLIDASMKNNALDKTLTNLKGSRFVDQIPRVQFKQALIPKEQIKKLMLESGLPKQVVDMMPEEITTGIAKMWAMQAPTDPDVVRVMRGGKTEYFRVNDPMLLTSLVAVNQSPLPGIFKPMRYMKSLLTSAVTADPTFMARNFIRDSMHSWTIAEEQGFKLGVDSFQGAIKSFKEEGGYIDMMFAGASFQGGYGNYNNPDAARKSMESVLRKKGISNPQGFMDSIVDTPKKYWEMYRSIGDAIENANREAILENAKRAGAEKAQYLFEAKDIMDFSMQGSFTLVRAMSDMLPFFNARLVGLYRLMKAGKTDEARRLILMKGASIAMFSLALLALNADNDDYEALEDFDKDQYWHLFVGDQHFRIPKPFELGLIFGTIPERSARALIGKDSLKEFAGRMGHGASDTLAFNPVPQMFRPFIELYANKDMFTGRPIENMSDEGKLPSARYNAYTSETMRILSSVLPEALGASPKRLEHLMQGYTGAMGMYILGATDSLVRVMSGMPESPSMRTDRLPVLKAFYQEKPAMHTVYGTQFYEMLREAEQIQRTINAYKKEGRFDLANELRTENADKLKVRKYLNKTNDKLSDVRKQIDAIYRSDLSPEQKRTRINSLMEKQNNTVQAIVKRTHPFFN
jgi:hypothetical protein